MVDVLIALLPIIGAGIYFYGMPALEILLVSIIFSISAEFIFNLITKRKQTLKDLSSVATGVVLALILPPYIPLWTAAAGAIFATVVVKLFFGGIGRNFMNPAGAAKAFLIASWAVVMTKPSGYAPINSSIKMNSDILNLILGQAKGNIGEASIAAILLGGVYLVIRRKISAVTPIAAILSAAIVTIILGKDVQGTVLTGALFFSAVIMATEPYTTPRTIVGQLVFGLCFGALSMVFTTIGHNPDGPYYAVIFMNLFTPVINYLTEKKKGRELSV